MYTIYFLHILEHSAMMATMTYRKKKNHPVAKEASSLTNKRNGRKFNQKNRTSETRKKLKRKDKAP